MSSNPGSSWISLSVYLFPALLSVQLSFHIKPSVVNKFFSCWVLCHHPLFSWWFHGKCISGSHPMTPYCPISGNHSIDLRWFHIVIKFQSSCSAGTPPNTDTKSPRGFQVSYLTRVLTRGFQMSYQTRVLSPKLVLKRGFWIFAMWPLLFHQIS